MRQFFDVTAAAAAAGAAEAEDTMAGECTGTPAIGVLCFHAV